MQASTARTPPSVANCTRPSYFAMSMASSRSITTTSAFSATSVLSSSTATFTSFSLHRKGHLRKSLLALLQASTSGPASHLLSAHVARLQLGQPQE